MNAAKTFESFLLFHGEKKIIVDKDTKVSNSAIYTLNKEDHTLGNMLRQELLNDPKVVFAGFKQPHPLDNYVIIRLQTRQNYTPNEAMNSAINSLLNKLNTLETKAKTLIQEKKDFD